MSILKKKLANKKLPISKKKVVRKKTAKKKVGSILKTIKHKATLAKKKVAYSVIDKTLKQADKKEKAALNKAKKTIRSTYIGSLPKIPQYVTQYTTTVASIANAQKTLDEINYRMKLRPHPQMKLQMKENQTKLKKYIREQKTHARELKKLL